MSCACNPEGQEGHPEIKLTPSKCDGCGRCVQVCPANAIQLDVKRGGDKVEIDRELCTNYGRYITVGELLDIVRKEKEDGKSRSGRQRKGK